jgi:hypothetical protein
MRNPVAIELLVPETHPFSVYDYDYDNDDDGGNGLV